MRLFSIVALAGFCPEKIPRGGMWFYKGVLRKTGCRTWFFDGENVVQCCDIVVIWMACFWL
jgi:hypothetical protein